MSNETENQEPVENQAAGEAHTEEQPVPGETQTQAEAATGGDLQAKIEELKDKYVRLFADFDNYKKRVARERLELIKDATQAKITHVPYRGNTPAVTAVLAGEVDGGVLATPGMLPHVQTGKITALAVTSRQRSRLAPELPTVAEAGLKALEQEVLYVVMVPAATPDAVALTLQKGIVEALKRPDVQARMNQLDLVFEGLTGAQAAQRMDAQYNRYGPIVKATGMKVE